MNNIEKYVDRANLLFSETLKKRADLISGRSVVTSDEMEDLYRQTINCNMRLSNFACLGKYSNELMHAIKAISWGTTILRFTLGYSTIDLSPKGTRNIEIVEGVRNRLEGWQNYHDRLYDSMPDESFSLTDEVADAIYRSRKPIFQENNPSTLDQLSLRISDEEILKTYQKGEKSIDVYFKIGAN